MRVREPGHLLIAAEVMRRILIDLNGPQGARGRSTACPVPDQQWIGDSLDG